MKITFDFENCFGITRLNKEIDFKEKQSVIVIYAPNGMMKSSFALTCAETSKMAEKLNKRGRTRTALDNFICDRMNPDAESKYEIKVNGTNIDPECIFVANPDQEEFDASRQVTDFLSSKALKDKYDHIVGMLEKARKNFVIAVGSNNVS